MGKNGKPYMANLAPVIQAGIDPKTGLPLKVMNDEVDLVNDIFRQLSIIDRQDAINRYVWYNLPDGITGQLLENLLYYKGQLMFFYIKEKEKFYILPYSLNGSIDVYGRYSGVSPLTIGTTEEDKDDAKPSTIRELIKGKSWHPVYEVMDPSEVTLDDFDNACVLIKDYNAAAITQNVIPRDLINKPLLKVMAEIIPYMRTALENSTGVLGMRVPEGCEASVMSANNSVKKASLNGQRWIPVTGDIDFQELASGSTLKAADFMQAMESLDNYRLSLYGIENGGLFQKKAHMLQEEQALANGNVGLVMQDGLTLRQEFCNRVNAIWQLGIWCEVSETVTAMDKNLDGEVSDEQDNQAPIDMGGGEDDGQL